MEAPSEQSVSAIPVRLPRPARALIGWLEPNEAVLWLAGRHVGQHQSPDNLQRAAEARAAVQRRTPGISQGDIIAEAPLDIVGHVAALRASPVGAPVFAEGFRVVVARWE